MNFESEAQPVRVNLPSGPADPWNLINTFFGHYDLRVYYPSGSYVDVDRGSFKTLKFLQVGSPEPIGCFGRIGKFVQSAGCAIMARTDHRNEEPVNYTFSDSLPILWQTIKDRSIQGLMTRPDRSPFEIGDNVILSQGCIVLPGAKIASGVVIGANAVVRDAPEPFAIYAGAPARKVKDRFTAEMRGRVERARWWDFSITYMGRHIERLQEVAVSDGPHEYRAETPRFIFQLVRVNGAETFELRGFVEGDLERPISQAPEKVLAYALQAMSGGAEWVSNIWLA